MLHVRLSLEAHFPAGIPVVFPGWQPTRNSSTRSPAWDFGSLLHGVFRRGFFIFYFCFFTKIYFCFRNLQKYTPAAPLPGPSCPAAGRQVLFCKNFCEFFAEKSLPPRSGATRSRPPGSGAAMVYSCKFWKRKYIFVKNKNKEYKNKKTAPLRGRTNRPRPSGGLAHQN